MPCAQITSVKKIVRMTNISADKTIIKMRPSSGHHNYKKQILAALAVSLGPFAAGLSKGYMSPAIASLQDNSTQPAFTVSDQQASWIAALSLLGALLGGILGGLSMKLGRKRVLIVVAPPFSIAWLATAYSSSVNMISATSFLAGVLCCIISMVTQIYVSEIAEPEIRGCLNSVLKILSHIGCIISFTVGVYFNWSELALVVAVAPVLLLFSLFFIPETPSFLMYKGRDEDAAKSLQWLRGPDADIQLELATIRSNIKKYDKSRSWSSFMSVRLSKPVLITCGLMFFQRFSGSHAFNYYAVKTFKNVLRTMDPHAGAIAMAGVQLIASCISGLLIDIVGRLPLLLASGGLMSLALAGFGSYVYYIQELTHCQDLNSVGPGFYDWIPLTCVLTFTLAFYLGISPISWLLIAELFPLEYRGFGNGLATTFSYFCGFINVKTFQDFQDLFGLYGCFWLYAFISVLSLVFVVLFVPETRGQAMDEMGKKDVESEQNEVLVECHDPVSVEYCEVCCPIKDKPNGFINKNHGSV